jgi:SNF2 family DNA or RNA helicase
MQVKLLDQNTIGCFFDYDPKIVSLIKSLPGHRFEPSLKAWCFAIDGLIGDTLKTLTLAGFAVPAELLRVKPTPDTPTLGIWHLNASKIPKNLPLYPFQREIVDFMVSRGSCLNASFVGAGKTLTSLVACEALGAKRVLVIVPKSVLLQWATQEIPKWLPGVSVQAITGSKKDREKTYKNISYIRYNIIGYETARVDIEHLLPFTWDVIMCDEAHRLANVRTQTYKALKLLKADRRFCLTATPIMNKAEDMFGVINFIRPGILGNYYSFLNRYIVKDMWGGVKFYKNMEELAKRCSPFIIRKTLEESALQLPEKTITDIPVSLSTEELSLYDKIKRELLFDIETQAISKIQNPIQLQSTIVKLGKLFELCDSLELLGDSTKSSKLEALKEHLEGVLIDE